METNTQGTKSLGCLGQVWLRDRIKLLVGVKKKKKKVEKMYLKLKWVQLQSLKDEVV